MEDTEWRVAVENQMIGLLYAIVGKSVVINRFSLLFTDHSKKTSLY